MILQVAFFRRRIITNGAEELAWVDVELNVLFEIAAVGGFVVAVRADQRLRPVVHLPRVTSHFVLVRGHVAALVTFERLLT